MTAGRLLQRHVRLSAFGQASTQELSAPTLAAGVAA
jgi:hypothetical protein